MNSQPLLVFLSVSFLLIAESALTLAPAISQEAAPIPIRNTNITQLSPPVLFRPSTTGRPPSTRGAGSRNDRLCPQDAAVDRGVPLTALVPSNQEGLTEAERPTVWVYLPATSARQIVLSVWEEGSQSHSQRILPITGEAGIVGITVDAAAPPLEVDRSYQWAVVLLCGDRPSPNDPVVTAWMRRVALPDAMNIPQNALERAAWYGDRGIWYDALTILAVARRSQPAFDPIWTDFLTQLSVGLAAIVNAPLL